MFNNFVNESRVFVPIQTSNTTDNQTAKAKYEFYKKNKMFNSLPHVVYRDRPSINAHDNATANNKIILTIDTQQINRQQHFVITNYLFFLEMNQMERRDEIWLPNGYTADDTLTSIGSRA